MAKIVLASGSPRRQELLQRIGITDFDVRVPQTEETYPAGLSPRETVEYISREKSDAAAALCTAEEIVITAEGTAKETRELLAAVPYIASVEADDSGEYVTAHIKTNEKDIHTASRAIFFAYARKGRALLEMSLKNASLEDVFIELTESEVEKK